jgi:hypothetical protein
MVESSQICMKHKNKLVYMDYKKDLENYNNGIERLHFIMKYMGPVFNYDHTVRMSKVFVNMKKGMVFNKEVSDEITSLMS